ncbi:MAG: hypothetical protein KC458_11775, partial [Dehalococcoidia bacterium]|nr:hypothetical protein [Dehalococcoidia bacterium]
MAYFDDELAQNGVHELLSRCETALDSFVKSPWTEADPRSLEYLEVARAATQFTRGQLAIQNA